MSWLNNFKITFKIALIVAPMAIVNGSKPTAFPESGVRSLPRPN
ncbi:hypothetical protein BH11PSE4_BH11PSE4_32410 [soil metagenome]